MKNRHGVRVLLALLAVVALTAAGCGDDSESGEGDASGTGQGTLQFTPRDAGGPLTKAALADGEIDVAVLFTSDADIAVNEWVLLEDDKKLQPAENLLPAIRSDVDSPELQAALASIADSLTTAELTELNRQQSQDKSDSADIAEAWLAAKNLVPYDGDKVSGTIVVGSTNFGEQEIVAEIYAQVLESAGADVERKFKLGSREVVAPALERGDIDVYPEYIGSYTAFVDPAVTVSTDLDTAVQTLADLVESKGVVLGKPAAAEDKNGFVVTAATAAKYNLSKTSDLASVSDTLVLGGPPECPQRPHCGIGLTETYGLTITS